MLRTGGRGRRQAQGSLRAPPQPYPQVFGVDCRLQRALHELQHIAERDQEKRGQGVWVGWRGWRREAGWASAAGQVGPPLRTHACAEYTATLKSLIRTVPLVCSVACRSDAAGVAAQWQVRLTAFWAACGSGAGDGDGG